MNAVNLEVKATAHGAVIVATEIIAEINREHKLAASHAKEAVQHAVRCGELLLEQKKHVAHGEFSKWISVNCEFAYSTAARYMTAAKQISTGVEIPSLSALFPSGRSHSPSAAEDPEAHGRPMNEPQRTTKPRPQLAPTPSTTDTEAADEITVEEAIKTLITKTGSKYSTIISAVRISRSKVTKLSNQLIEAKNELARAEAAVMRIHREFRP